MNTPSTCPLPATLVSPATIRTPTSAAVFSMASAISSRVCKGNPSSMTKPQVRYRGTAPMQARSLTVPQMESFPILPPAKKAGETINPSVDMAIRPFSTSMTAASSAVKSGFWKCFLKTRSISSDVCLPPAPCASVTVSLFVYMSIVVIFLHTDKMPNMRLHRIPCRRRRDAPAYTLCQRLCSRKAGTCPAERLRSGRPDCFAPRPWEYGT